LTDAERLLITTPIPPARRGGRRIRRRQPMIVDAAALSARLPLT
jgi:hypothetical protein